MYTLSPRKIINLLTIFKYQNFERIKKMSKPYKREEIIDRDILYTVEWESPAHCPTNMGWCEETNIFLLLFHQERLKKMLKLT